MHALCSPNHVRGDSQRLCAVAMQAGERLSILCSRVSWRSNDYTCSAAANLAEPASAVSRRSISVLDKPVLIQHGCAYYEDADQVRRIWNAMTTHASAT